MNAARRELTDIYTVLKSECQALLATPDDIRKTAAVIDIDQDCDKMLCELSDELYSILGRKHFAGLRRGARDWRTHPAGVAQGGSVCFAYRLAG